MPCTDEPGQTGPRHNPADTPAEPARDWRTLIRWQHPPTWLLAAAMAGCSSPMPPWSPVGSTPAQAPVMPPVSGAAVAPLGGFVQLPAPGPVRNWNELREQAARRLVAANPNGSYTGQPQEVLLAIPVLEVELNADGSIRRIEVLRQPGQARDTVQLAIDALRRAAPFGEVSHLPRPWKFAETFLFNNERRFKPRTLD